MSGDISLCPDTGDVEICINRDIELCVECDELTLTGIDTPVVGTIYAAGGGSGTLNFSFSAGTITKINAGQAEITAINECSETDDPRWATVSVVDECDPKQTAEIEVRLPGGRWVNTDEILDESGECISYNVCHMEFCAVGRSGYTLTWRYTDGGLNAPCGDSSARPDNCGCLSRIQPAEWRCQ